MRPFLAPSSLAARTALALALVAGCTSIAVAQQPTRAATDTTRAHPAVVKHTVKKGDTLWDIAKFYLKDPFRWPEVFHANTDIVKNPHWIYPGQVLTIDGAAVKDEVAAQVDSAGFVVTRIQTRAQAPTVFAEGAPVRATMSMGSIEKAPALTVRPGEYAAAPYVVAANRPLGAGRLLGGVETPALGLSSTAGFKMYDRVYVTPPAGMTLHAGDRVVVARTHDDLSDAGTIVEPTGVLRIDSVASRGPAIAELVSQFGDVVPDQIIVAPGESFEATIERPVGGTFPTSAKLLWIKGSPELPSLQTYVVLAAGQATGVRPGDQFTVYDDAASKRIPGVAPVATATVKIVRVTPLASSGVIVDQTQPQVRAGMAARLTAKMP